MAKAIAYWLSLLITLSVIFGVFLWAVTPGCMWIRQDPTNGVYCLTRIPWGGWLGIKP